MVTQEEAEQRIEQDDGDASDLVWVKPSYAGGRSAYHSNRDCRGLQKVSDPRSFKRGQAQQRLFAPCLICTLETGDRE